MAVDRCRMIDSEYFTVGDADDGKWFHDGTNTYFTNDTGVLYIKNTSHGDNIVFSAEDSGGTEQAITFDPDLKGLSLNDSTSSFFGTGNDAFIRYDGVKFIIRSTSGNLLISQSGSVSGGEIQIDNNAHGFKTVFTNENASGVDKTLLTLDPDKETAKVMGLEGTSVTISADTDNQDVLGISIIKVDSSGGNIIIGGLANGVTDQIIFMYKNDSANTVTIEHQEGTGIQKFKTEDTNDISLGNFGLLVIVFDGTDWIVHR